MESFHVASKITFFGYLVTILFALYMILRRLVGLESTPELATAKKPLIKQGPDPNSSYATAKYYSRLIETSFS